MISACHNNIETLHIFVRSYTKIGSWCRCGSDDASEVPELKYLQNR